MPTLQYDAEHLTRQIEQLHAERRTAFAAACAQRLLPSYRPFWNRTGRGDPVKLEQLLDRLWADLTEERMRDDEVQESIDACMALIPAEDEGWVAEQPLAEDAASALAYALRCRQTGKGQEAAYAASTMYSALAQFITDRDDPPDGRVRGFTRAEVQSKLARVLADPLMQAELARHQRDIDDLLVAADGAAVIARLRERARAEAPHLFESAN